MYLISGSTVVHTVIICDAVQPIALVGHQEMPASSIVTCKVTVGKIEFNHLEGGFGDLCTQEDFDSKIEIKKHTITS